MSKAAASVTDIEHQGTGVDADPRMQISLTVNAIQKVIGTAMDPKVRSNGSSIHHLYDRTLALVHFLQPQMPQQLSMMQAGKGSRPLETRLQMEAFAQIMAAMDKAPKTLGDLYRHLRGNYDRMGDGEPDYIRDGLRHQLPPNFENALLAVACKELGVEPLTIGVGLDRGK